MCELALSVTHFVPPRLWLATFFCSAGTCVVSASSLHSRGGFYVVTLVFCVFDCLKREDRRMFHSHVAEVSVTGLGTTDAGITDCDTSPERMAA